MGNWIAGFFTAAFMAGCIAPEAFIGYVVLGLRAVRAMAG